MATRPTPARVAPLRRTVAGTWRSELGSEVELHVTDGFLSGRYRSAVGTVQQSQSLIGFCTPPTATGTVVLGFVVCWADTGSVTTWTGSYDRLSDRLHLTWLLEAAATPETGWRSTTLGQDVFERTGSPPAPARIRPGPRRPGRGTR